MKIATISLLAALTLAFTGCVVHHDGPDCDHEPCADIGFYWEFEYGIGVTDDCILAGVARVEFTILDIYDKVIYTSNRPCSEEGAIITDFFYDTYQIFLEGIDPDGYVIYEGLYEVDVFEPGLNDFDYLTLDYL